MTAKLSKKKAAVQAAEVQAIVEKFLSPSIDREERKMLLTRVVLSDSPDAGHVLQEIFRAARSDAAREEYLEKQQHLDEVIAMLNEGPLRVATFLGISPGHGEAVGARAHVVLDNGDSALPALLHLEEGASLECGDSVLLDAQARAVLGKAPAIRLTGEVGRLKRLLGDDRVLVSLNDLNSEAYRLTSKLQEQLASGEVQVGDEVLVCTRRRLAMEAIAKQEGDSGYMFLERGPVQRVDAQLDLGNPHPFIGELIEHVRDAMTNPELLDAYGVRRMQTRMLKGLTGTGKTYSILALIHGIYQVMSEVTGAPVDALPQRVMRMRPAHVLNKYLGESDKRQDRFFDEVLKLADEPFYWNGHEWLLPVIIRCEEIDSLARARHGAEDVLGRIQTTMLERLDHLADDLGQKLCLFLFTTNVPELLDQAFLRRAGGKIIHFGRADRNHFQSVLAKKIRGLPMHPDLGEDPQQAERRLTREVTNWLFSPNGHDPGQVEVTLAGSAKTIVCRRRDLLTGAVVDLSVQQAGAAAMQLAKGQHGKHGIDQRALLSAFDEQIRGMCEQVTEFNAHNYLPLPDGARVASVRRIPQPTMAPYDLERS